MPIFQGFADRLRGTANVILQNQVAEDIDRLICELLEAAAFLWEQAGWTAYNKEEVNCTVQLYRWCRTARRKELRFSYLIPMLEWVDVTPAILDGVESVKTAGRSDMRIEIGEIGRTIECKRLYPTGSWPREYVYEGLARFVVGSYGHDEGIGYMVGYVQAGTIAGILLKINQQIVGHPSMGTAHQLKPLRDNATSWCRSSHSRASGSPIRIDHMLVDVS
jgi:hypothetical protein